MKSVLPVVSSFVFDFFVVDGGVVGGVDVWCVFMAGVHTPTLLQTMPCDLPMGLMNKGKKKNLTGRVRMRVSRARGKLRHALNK